MNEEVVKENVDTAAEAVEIPAPVTVAVLTREQLVADLGKLEHMLTRLREQQAITNERIAAQEGAINYIGMKLDEIDKVNAPTIDLDQLAAHAAMSESLVPQTPTRQNARGGQHRKRRRR